MPAVSASTYQYNVTPTWTPVDFGLSSSLNVDTETVTTDPAYASYYTTTPPGTGRPPAQKASIASAWAQRYTSPSQIGQGAADWINLMNQVGISVGDVAVATGETTTAVRSYLLSNTFWTPLEVSSKDIYWAEMRPSPVGTFEIGVGGGSYYLPAGYTAYIHFYTAAPYPNKSYTATWTLSRFTTSLQYYGSVNTISLDKTYNIATFSPIGGLLSAGNLKFGESMWDLPPGGAVASGNPSVVKGLGDTDYLYTYQVTGSSKKQFVGFADDTQLISGFAPPIPTYTYQLYSADGDFAIGSVLTSNTSYVPSGFIAGGGSIGSTGGTALAASVSVQNRVITKNAATSFTPVSVTGGLPPYTFSIAPVLPAGLTLNAISGTVSGTPTTTQAAVNYTVTATDTDLVQVTGNFTLAISEQSSLTTTDLTTITNTLSNLATQLQSITNTLQTTATSTGISGVSTAVSGVSTAVSGVSTAVSDVNNTTLYIKNFLDNMPDYTTQLNQLVTALQTIATNSTTDSTSLTTVASTLGNISMDGAVIKVDIGDIDASLATVASKMTEIEKYQKVLKELGETTGIHIRGPYEALGLVSLYKLLIEQANILENATGVDEQQKARAIAKAKQLIDQLETFKEF